MIHFRLRDKGFPTNLSLQRKDSLIDYNQIRQRTKSQYVEEVSSESVSQHVQSLLDSYKLVKASDQNTQTQEALVPLEHSLKVLRVLWHFTKSLRMYKRDSMRLMVSESDL